MLSPSMAAPEWEVSPAPVPYDAALARMEARVAAIRAGDAPELVWLLQHPPVITAGLQASPDELLQPGRFPVVETGRGGRYTYHGPGQRVLYVLLDLRRRGVSVRDYVEALEGWIIAALAACGVEAFTHDDGVGIWVRAGTGIEKIGAIGIRVRHGVSFHGAAVNIDADLDHFAAIVPCGIRAHGVTRLADLAEGVGMARFDEALHGGFPAFLAALRMR